MLPPPFLDREMTATDMKPQFQIEKSVRKRLFKTSAERVMRRCEALAAVSESGDYIERTYLSDSHKRANAIVEGWIAEAKAEHWQDAVGNVWGRLPSQDADSKTLILGSHLDTIVDAGKYDGILGVLMAVELLHLLRSQSIALPFNIDVVGFCDEEGVRFGATLLGSYAIADRWKDDWLDLTDVNGVSIAEAMTSFGLDSTKVSDAAIPRENLAGYLEVHIEQGPVLDRANLPVGVVTAIAGARRFNFVIEGESGHAGTVPMEMRKDALVGACLCVQEVEKAANLYDVVATVGDINCHPGAVNVVPGNVQFSLDIRSARDKTRDAAFAWLTDRFDSILNSRDLAMSWQEIHKAPSVACSSKWQRTLEKSIADCNLEVLSLPSGAGHDAMAMENITPLGMLFVRCKDGISHHPAESIMVQDVEVAMEVLMTAIIDYALGTEEV
ncbi:MAG: allantoate amidohydrolase [Pseudomonadota bacterium]|nr:allantoate amidohydrolase [Pseudomonadota bacterium]MEC8072886.1 allantoate amidohydrolase [Pseudomonadota bacterium]MEC8349798.1 allantoate amidohydrolase [Pseudomonadota bacterium]|tara:strand:+ start:10122 stop:11447 length:1326 start_codon:yes stop_codon:yes gene_type:complete